MKRYRYNKIKEIVQSKAIETQEELAAALLEEGIEVTQANQNSYRRWTLSICIISRRKCSSIS